MVPRGDLAVLLLKDRGYSTWSTKYMRPLSVMRISHPDGSGPSWVFASCCAVSSCDRACCGLRVAVNVRFVWFLLGSSHVVFLVLWSTKYDRPSGVNLCSQPLARSPKFSLTVAGSVAEEGALVVFVLWGVSVTSGSAVELDGRCHDVAQVLWST